jgi:hypothetical protein
VAEEKGKVPLSVKIGIVVIILAAATGAIAWFGNPRLRASLIASKIGKGASNNPAVKQLMQFDTDIVLPEAIKMLKKDDHLSLRFGIMILNKLVTLRDEEDQKMVQARMDTILEFTTLPQETNVYNRMKACQLLQGVYDRKAKYAHRVIPFLKDDSKKVQSIAKSTTGKFLHKDMPGRSAEFWLEEIRKAQNEVKKETSRKDEAVGASTQ